MRVSCRTEGRPRQARRLTPSERIQEALTRRERHLVRLRREHWLLQCARHKVNCAIRNHSYFTRWLRFEQEENRLSPHQRRELITANKRNIEELRQMILLFPSTFLQRRTH